MPGARRPLVLYAGATLLANLFVILWGAYVRASGSGAGCGSHWPLCNGEVIPRAPAVQTLVEFTHRATSGVALLMVAGLVVWAWRVRPVNGPLRWGAALSLVFIILEALIGAGLVLFELVAGNASIARAWWMAAHLANTFLLLGVLTLTVRAAAGGGRLWLRGQGAVGGVLFAGLLLMLLLGASGAVTALGDTLYLAQPIVNGQRAGLSPTAQLLVSFRAYHPFIAVAVAAFVTTSAIFVRRARPSVATRRASRILNWLFLVQLGVGALNVWLQAPIWMQLVHLLLADAVWIAFVLLTASTLAQRPSAARAPAEQPLHLERQPA